MPYSKKCSICREVGHNKLNCKKENKIDIYVEKTCSICFEKQKQSKGTILTNCNHSFCFTCFMKWISKNNTCPLCRKVFFKKQKEIILEIEVPIEVPVEVEPNIIYIFKANLDTISTFILSSKIYMFIFCLNIFCVIHTINSLLLS